MIRLNCAVQNYAWGKIGQDSTVGRIHQVTQAHQAAQELAKSQLAQTASQSGEEETKDA